MPVKDGLKGRIALVTGGSRGIGKAISLMLAEDGADIAVNYHRDEDSAVKTVAEIEAMGRRAISVRASIENLSEVEAMVEEVLDKLGPVDLLVNNAGIASRGLSVADTTPEEVLRVMSVHALGPHHLSKLVIPGMREQPRGDIIMISSSATRGLAANGGPYNMAKTAGEALAQTLYKEERPYGTYVNIVAPGLVDTEMGRRLIRATAGVEDIHTLDERANFGHVCSPEEVASVVRFLVSPENTYVTGERIYVNGGS